MRIYFLLTAFKHIIFFTYRIYFLCLWMKGMMYDENDFKIVWNPKFTHWIKCRHTWNNADGSLFNIHLICKKLHSLTLEKLPNNCITLVGMYTSPCIPANVQFYKTGLLLEMSPEVLACAKTIVQVCFVVSLLYFKIKNS